MNHGASGWRAAAVALFALSGVACGSDPKRDDATAGSSAGGAGAGQNVGGADMGGAGQNAGGAVAVGGDTGVLGPSADCTFEIATSGAQVVSYAPEPLGCTALGYSDTLYALFNREDGWQTEFVAPGFAEGQTGVQLPARFQIGKLNFAGWMTGDEGCTVEVTEQVLLGPAAPSFTRAGGRQYRLTGHGSCSEPAVDPTGGMSDIVPGPFSFRARKSFYDPP